MQGRFAGCLSAPGESTDMEGPIYVSTNERAGMGGLGSGLAVPSRGPSEARPPIGPNGAV